MLFGKSDILPCLYFMVVLLIPDYAFSAEPLINRKEAQLVCPKVAGPSKCGFFNLTFKSNIDGSLQPLIIKLPESYTPQKKWPLLVTLHGLGDGPILAPQVESLVQIGPYGRGSVWFTGIGAMDVFESIEAAKKLFSIDNDRIYLCGFSMGGVATFDLGLRYPNMWAACVPVCGQCEDMYLVENGRHLPFWINAGGKDIILPPICSRKAYERAMKLGFSEWKYTEHPEMAHSFNIDWKGIENWLLTHKKVADPKQVSFTVKDLSANHSYWVEITGLKRYGSIAKIDVSVDGQTINVATNNISGYTLRLNNKLVDLNKELEIKENNAMVFKDVLGDEDCFVKAPKSNQVFIKSPQLSGPIWDIYCSSCILLYGTNCTGNSLIRAARQCALSFRDPQWMKKVDFRVLPDTAVTRQDLLDNNLVLFGNTHTNRVLSEISDKLPIEMNGNCVIARDLEYSGDNIGYILIYPNPLNPLKYVAVFSGNTTDTIDCFDKIWPYLNSTPKNIDVGIFEFVGENGKVKWHLKEAFGTNWDWLCRNPKSSSKG